MRWTHETHVGHDADDPAPVTKFELVRLATEAKQALVTSGFSKTEARDAVEAAAAQLGPTLTLEALIFEALRRCPKPRG